MIDKVRLRHAIPERRKDVRYILRHIYAPDEGPVTVSLTVVADEEKEYVLEVGGTFSVRDETWVVDQVDPMSNDVRVVLRLVE